MDRRTTPPCFIFLAPPCFQSTAHPFFEGNSPRGDALMAAVATSSGVVDLKKESNSSTTFYVGADLSNLSSSLGGGGPDTVGVLISLMGDYTMVAGKCLGFNPHDCSTHKCVRKGPTKTIDHPWPTATAGAPKSGLYLDYKYWGLSSAALYIASSCQTGGNLTALGSGPPGALGLGTGSGVIDDFTPGALPPILIEPDLGAGGLIFKRDTDKYTHPKGPAPTSPPSSGWGFSAGQIKAGGSPTHVGPCAFGTNPDVIGMPGGNPRDFIKAFAPAPPGAWCNGGVCRPYCYTKGGLKDLPKIFISPNYHPQLEITPQIYLTMDKGAGVYKYFHPNPKATDPTLTGKNYVPPPLQYKVTLGANFMSYYYVVFDDSSNYKKIDIYPSINARELPTPSPKEPERNNSRDLPPVFGPLVVLGFFGSFCVCSWCCCRSSKNQRDGRKNLVNETIEDFYATPTTQQGVVGGSHPNNPYRSDEKQGGGLYQAY